MDRREYLKPSRFGNIEQRRILDKKNLKEKRSIRRTSNFNLRRNIEDIAQEVKENITEKVSRKKDPVLDRKLALQKFRAEKETKKRALNEKKKPPFIVGIPHHGSSPLLKHLGIENKCRKETKTTATQEFTFQSQKVQLSTKKLTSPHTPTVLKRSVQKKPLKTVSNLVAKLRNSPKNTHLQDESDELLAAPLPISEEVDVIPSQETVGGNQDPGEGIENSRNLSAFDTSDILKLIKSENEEINIQGGGDDPVPVSQVRELNPKTKLRRNPKRSHLHEPDEGLPAPLIKVENNVNENHEEESPKGTQKKNEILENLSPRLNEAGHVIETEEEGGVKRKGENDELANEVAFQHSRLQTETKRLQEMADQWQTVILHESMPQEVVDEVDSLVGQTRLLTSDKFQQYHRLIVQFENKTGTHPITLDDLNGFWDMVYLQVESLDKKYASLEVLKNNNWVNPEPATKKKRRPAKKLKINKVTVEKSTTPEKIKKQTSLQLPEDQQIQTPTTDPKSVINSVLFNRIRTRSNSPSPYIAMRLSAIGRTPNTVDQPPKSDGTPRSISVNTTKAVGTPKNALKKAITGLSESTSKRSSLFSTMSSFETKIEEAVEETNHLNDTEEPLVVAFTPRRSMRLIKKPTTPSQCSVCDSTGCDKSMCKIPSTPATSSKKSRQSQKSTTSPRQSQKSTTSPVIGLQEAKTKSDIIEYSASKSTRRSKKLLTFSPSESQHKGDCATVTDIDKPSTSGVRFSLRPSILTITENDNFSEIPKKTKKRRQASVFSATTTELVAEEPMRAKSQRSTRQSRRVTFESGAEEKFSFKLPATPYRKYHADS